MNRSLNKHVRFFVVFLLFSAVVAGIRIHWIWEALPAKATVLFISDIRINRSTQYFPVVTYETRSGVVRTRGTYNLPVKPGEIIDIVYDPANEGKFRINTTWWLWYDIWSWYRLLLILIALYYITLFIVKRSLQRSETEPSRAPLKMPAAIREVNPARFTAPPAMSTTSRYKLRKRYKVLILFLLPLSIIIIGEVFSIPYTRAIGAFIFAGYILLGNLYGTDRFEK